MDRDWKRVAVFLLLVNCVNCSGTAKEWTYAGAVGQSEWAEVFPDCGGSSQSPINVVMSRTVHDPTLLPVEPLGYNQQGKHYFTLFNNGQTVTMALPRLMGVAGLPWHYSAVQLHLHWGNGVGVATGSEHTINGRSSSAELHVVHYNTELYSNMSEAKTHEVGLAVLAVLIEAGEEVNHAYSSILNYLGRIKYAGQKVDIPAFDVNKLLPDDLSRYFRYNGSLTTPPCFQSVLWTLFYERVQISHSQLMKLETVLYSSKAGAAEPSALQDNYRITQPLNNRTVLSSFIPELIVIVLVQERDKDRQDYEAVKKTCVVSIPIYTAGEIAAIVIGALCGCLGLAVIIRFIVKSIRSTSSWDVPPISIRPAPQPRTNDAEKDVKQDVALKTTSDPEKPEEVTPQPHS